jgi:hypothetical protein
LQKQFFELDDFSFFAVNYIFGIRQFQYLQYWDKMISIF